MTSIDTSIRINYKHCMGQKSKILGLSLVFLLASCNQPGVLVPSTSTPSPALEENSTPTALISTSSISSPEPEVRITIADQALFNGDFSLAQTEYGSAFTKTADPAIRAAALWGLGRVNLQAGNHGAALNSFNKLIADYPDSPHRVHSHLIRGEIMLYLERNTEAVEAFSSYLSLRPGIIDSYVFEQRADAYYALGRYELAISDYQAALISPHLAGDTGMQVKLAQAYGALGDSSSAFDIYNSIFDNTSVTNLKAQMDLYRGRLHLSLGQPSEAYAYFLHCVESYPLEYESYSALIALLDGGIQVDDLQRGLVDFYAGQYGYAIDAFDRYATQHPDNDGTVFYYRALALRDAGLSSDALEAFSFFTQQYSSNLFWAAAWEEKADMQWYLLGDYEGAAETLLEYTRRTSDLSSIPRILLLVGRIYERSGNLANAVNRWESIADQYPGSEYVPQALFQAGVVAYRMGDYLKAQVDFQRAYLFSTTLEDQARSVFWTGKTQGKLGDSVGEHDSFLQAAAIDQTNYYSLRAQDMLFSRSPFGLPGITSYEIDLTSERAKAESWMRITFDLDPETDLADLGTLAVDGRMVRGNEFWILDMVDQALLEFEDLRVSVSENAVDSYNLGNYLFDLKLYRPAIFALRQVLTLAGMEEQVETLAAPRYFNLIRYGFYYQDLVIPQSLASGFDPLLIFSIIRQESLFDKDAGSGQGALGLMQITPGTAQLIVDGLGWPLDFQTPDLFRPMINLTLGISHLSDLEFGFSNELFPALAAYNAGQNAAVIWRDLSGSDPDLFVETIRYPETHDYVISIYEIYFMYNNFYTISP